MMTCEQAKLQIQALLDNEIEEHQIAPLISHLESCYTCRNEYINFLKLQRKLAGIKIPEPPKEWFEQLPNKVLRRTSGIFGKVLFFGSYALLLGYALYSLLRDRNTQSIIKIGIGGIAVGFLVLLGITIADRVRESKNDRYKGVMK
jgi:predicted anti-sigma-YlaC factor YlaD